MRARLIVAALTFALTAAIAAQAPDAPKFEVASVKVLRPGIASMPKYGSNTWRAFDLRLRFFLGIAFDVPVNHIVGLPDWEQAEAYAIDAKTEDGVRLSPEGVRPLLRQLLVERFKLAAHLETTSASGYGLVVAKGGPKLTETTKPFALTALDPKSRISATSTTMDVLAQILTQIIEEPVGNETGLPGNFEFTVTFAPEGATDSPQPSIFTALEEQLGLKLEGGHKVPIETLVIDHVEHPTED